MTTAVKVYGSPLCHAVSRVLVCLLEKDVQFQIFPVKISKGQHKKPDYLKIQPFGQVPAFQDEDISLFESRAICRYVCDKYANQGNKELYGTNPLERASIDQWLEAEGQNFFKLSAMYIFQLKNEPSEGLIKHYETMLAALLDVYENRLGESRYLAGDKFTLADLSHLPVTQLLVKATERMITSRTNMRKWWDEISSRESWKEVIEMQTSRLHRHKYYHR